MRRLIRKLNSEKEVYVPLNELDEADVKFNRCPICKGADELKRENGFKHCPNCKSKYKTFDGNVYIVQ
ncbi:gp172 [Bacillus phage G]|uniref:Gp172 n=1 Tax=Bacillus phage G TaxID=2884420 RepID=G3MBN8_9CAUD|nr:gp172 [Bacillus phage G]AEO93432.1 gp172 [Bacillus phage G]